MIQEIENKYLDYLNKALSYYSSDDLFVKFFGRVPKFRDITFNIKKFYRW